MPRRLASSALLVLGLLSALGGHVALALRSTVLDESAAVAGARAALAEPSLRAELTELLADATVTALALTGQATAPGEAGADLRSDATAVAASVIDEPAFLAAYDIAVGQLHDRVLRDPAVVPQLDLTELVSVVRARLVGTDPAYDAVLAPQGRLLVALPVRDLPDLTAVNRTLSGSQPALAVIAGVAACLAGLALSPPARRPRRLRGVGTLLVSAGLLQLGAGYVAHLAVGRMTGATAAVVRAVLQPMLGRIAMPGFIPVALGALTFAVAHRRAGRTTLCMADRGRAAFLTDPSGRPTEWCFDAAFEPETLRTAPGTLTHRH
jgi:hypothetical protein